MAAKRFDFSEDLEPIEIVYNDDLFLVAAEAPADTIADLADLMNASSDAAKVHALKEFMFQILLPEYLEKYKERLSSPTKPIGFKALMKTFEVLVEHYTNGMGDEEGSRPTEEVSPLPTGVTETGDPSVAPSLSVVAPTPAISPLVSS